MTCLAALRLFLADILDPARAVELARLKRELSALTERVYQAEIDAQWAAVAASPQWLKEANAHLMRRAVEFKEQRDRARDALAGMMEERGW